MRILYVENDPVQAAIVQNCIEDAGHCVAHHSNAFNALLMLNNDSAFDLVLTDHFMPNMTGLDLVAQIQQKAIPVPVIIMTSASDLSLAFSAVQAGATDFIAKDSESAYLSILIPVIERAVQKYRLEQQALALEQKPDKEQELCYQALDALSQGIIVFDEAQEVKFCNNFFKEQFALSPDTRLVGKTLDWCASLFQQAVEAEKRDDENFSQAHLRETLACIGQRLELPLKSSVLEVTSVALKTNGFALTLTDITRQIEKLETTYHLIRVAPIAMIAVDSTGEIVLANERAVEIIDDKLDTILGCNIQRLIPFEYRANHKRIMANYFNNPIPRVMRPGIDLELLSFSGKSIPVEISLSNVYIGKKSCALATIVDVSRRKEAERAIKNAHKLTS